jgi:hypothetical protein
VCPATGPCDPTGTIPAWVFNVSTNKWEQADQSSFTYDAKTGYWLSPKYFLNRQTGWYEIIPPAQVAALPSNFVTAPNVIHTSLGDVVVGSKDYELAKALGIIPSGSSANISSTGPNSTNQANATNSSQSWFDFTSLVNVMNTLQSTAKSGDVSATDNTKVGDAVSGAANVLANLVNLLTSAWSWSNGGLNMFMQNLFGNINGDITLTPNQTSATGGGSMSGSTISGTGPDSTNGSNAANSTTLGVNAKTQGDIVNNVDLIAASGNASAGGNTSAGNVASGNATAELNIINLINSYISSGSSFFGVLNIFGNLNGDILFPSGFLNGAIGTDGSSNGAAGLSSTGPGSANTSSTTDSNSSNITSSSTNSIANNIDANATSGQANINNNSQAGSASSGSASTTGSTFNLANSNVMGDNAVLVIVNVLGHWVGKIMSLPGGGSSTSGLLTGNAQISSTGPNSVNIATTSTANSAKITQSAAGSITNNAKVAATSGNASATDNTQVGDVKSGNAKVSTGVANIVNTVLNVKHWFGVLVVNVFGGWTGDVGNNTSAGNAPAPAAAPLAEASNVRSTVGTVSSALSVPTPEAAVIASNAVSKPAVTAPVTGQVLAAASQLTSNALGAAQTRNFNIIFWISSLVLLLAGAAAALERRLRVKN